jgi:hypothetical protein
MAAPPSRCVAVARRRREAAAGSRGGRTPPEKHVTHILRKLNTDATLSDHRRELAVLASFDATLDKALPLC